MITNVLGTLKYLGHKQDDDFIDRLHYFLTSNVLIALSVLVSWKQFGGRPVECLVPDMFSGAWEQYVENYCWAQDTYMVSFDEVNVPLGDERTSEERRIGYYQWVPFFLLIQACCFRLPSLVWKYLAAHSGIKIHDIVKLAIDERNIEPQVKDNNIKSLTIHLQNALRFHRRLQRRHVVPHRVLRFLNLPYSAFYVTFLYLITKLLYLINVFVQIVFMNRFLETDHYSWYGFGALYDIMNGSTWEQSRIFPRVTLCDFKVRAMGSQIQPYTVQCVLTINIFTEKIFIFLWFWYVTLMLLTAMSFLYWTLVSLLPFSSRWFVSRHLELSEMPFDPNGSRKDVERFVTSYLKPDGVFVLRMITMHSGVIFGTELVLSLWRSFYPIEEQFRRSNSDEAPTEPQTADENKMNILRLRRNKGGKGDKDEDLKEILVRPTMSVDDSGMYKKRPELISLTTKSNLDMPDSKSQSAKPKPDYESKKALKLIMP